MRLRPGMSSASSSVSFSPAYHFDHGLPQPLVAGKGRHVSRGHGDRRAGPPAGSG